MDSLYSKNACLHANSIKSVRLVSKKTYETRL